MSDKIHICHFLNICENGGTVDMIINLMQHSKHDHTYVTYRASELRKEEFKNKGLSLVELGESYEEAVKFMKSYAHIVHAANSGGPEPGVSIGLTAGIPVVETVQAPVLPQGSIHPTVHVVPVSKGIVDRWPLDIRYERFIYSCAAAVYAHDKRMAKEHFGLDPNLPVVGRIGRLEGLKRPQDFLSAIPHIHRRRPEVQYLLAGDGADGAGIRGMAQNLIATDAVEIKMPGFLTGYEKDLAYNAIDIFLYPTSEEGFGCVFAEAMSIGLPIVTYSDPINTDIVGGAGVYAPDNLFVSVSAPWKSLSSLTIDLLENPRECKKLSEAGITRYQRYFTPERMAREYDELYEQIYEENL